MTESDRSGSGARTMRPVSGVVRADDFSPIACAAGVVETEHGKENALLLGDLFVLLRGDSEATLISYVRAAGVEVHKSAADARRQRARDQGES